MPARDAHAANRTAAKPTTAEPDRCRAGPLPRDSAEPGTLRALSRPRHGARGPAQVPEGEERHLLFPRTLSTVLGLLAPSQLSVTPGL